MNEQLIKVPQINGESRKEYLVRVAIIMLKNSGYNIEPIEYDNAECDAFCLAEDLENEFDIDPETV